MNKYLKLVLIIGFTLSLLSLHFYLVHYKKLIELSINERSSETGYLLEYGPIGTSENSLRLFFKLNLDLIILFSFLTTLAVFINIAKKYSMALIFLSATLFMWSYVYRVAMLTLVQVTGTWSNLDTLMIGLFGY